MIKDLQVTRRHKGFTLIELLVVISVIGILASLAIVSFSGSQKQARDTQRKSDLKQFQNSLELFANRNDGNFPSRTDATGANASSTLCNDLGLTSCPEDPRFDEDNSFVYKYQSDGTGASSVDALNYVLWGKLENTSVTTYWVYCSSGTAGEATSGIPPVAGACPI